MPLSQRLPDIYRLPPGKWLTVSRHAFVQPWQCVMVVLYLKLLILSIESMLVSVMAQLASTDGKLRVGVQDVSDIEAICDKYSSRIESRGFKFVLPGESVASAAFHVARTVARRCERCVIRYAKAEPVDEELLKYLNRISDVMYAMAICVDLEE